MLRVASEYQLHSSAAFDPSTNSGGCSEGSSDSKVFPGGKVVLCIATLLEQPSHTTRPLLHCGSHPRSPFGLALFPSNVPPIQPSVPGSIRSSRWMETTCLSICRSALQRAVLPQTDEVCTDCDPVSWALPIEICHSHVRNKSVCSIVALIKTLPVMTRGTQLVLVSHPQPSFFRIHDESDHERRHIQIVSGWFRLYSLLNKAADPTFRHRESSQSAMEAV